MNPMLAYDLGGTKVLAGVVSPDGRVLEKNLEYVIKQQGKAAVLDQLVSQGLAFLEKYPEIDRVGVASAGPLNPITGELLDATNLVTGGEGWGIVPLAQILSERLNRPVAVENDAAAFVLGERWKGHAQGIENCVVMTLGTGVGIGAVCNGQLVRSGRNLHPEGGHIPLDINDRVIRCACGKWGCMETFLSGVHFTKRVALQWQEPQLTARSLASLARSGEPRALQAFRDYARYFAAAVDALVMLYAPELIIISGGFAETAEYFLKDVDQYLEQSLQRRRQGIDLYPRIVVSQHKSDIGLLGAAYVASQQRRQ